VKRICGILLALVLSVSMMLVPAGVKANGGITGAVTLSTIGYGTAEWTTEEQRFGSYSVKLTMPPVSWEETERIHNAEAEVDVIDTPLAEITGFEFWQKLNTVDLWVGIEFNLDNGETIRGVYLLPDGKAPGTDWFAVTEADFIFDGGKTWERQQADFPGATVEYVDIGYGIYTTDPDETVVAFIDDLTIQQDGSSTTYVFEPPPTCCPMTEFKIDYARFDFEKGCGSCRWGHWNFCDDDENGGCEWCKKWKRHCGDATKYDKVRVIGKLELDPNCGGADISKPVTVTVGPVSETITMVEKGKKGMMWWYKRPKGGEGPIKMMIIIWKTGRFAIRMDKADLTGVTNPVTISIQIGDNCGEETILMREKKYHWDYKAPHH